METKKVSKSKRVKVWDKINDNKGRVGYVVRIARPGHGKYIYIVSAEKMMAITREDIYEILEHAPTEKPVTCLADEM